MVLISVLAAPLTTSAASSASNKVNELPPVILIMASVAPSIVVSSNGLATACLAASMALFSPTPIPIPIIALPRLAIIALTSAKSKLTRPDTAIKSDIDWTPLLKTLSTSLKASIIGVVLSIISLNLSFGITIMVSTCFLSSSIPTSACSILFLPSNLKGLVTIPTVSAPSSWAISATIGAAPVPVPPPIPQVTKTISAPCKASSISFLLSWAASLPISGLAPAPKPSVKVLPICNLVSALLTFNTCKSVLATINSTPITPDSIILLTALHPPPPTPITLIFAIWSTFASYILSLLI